MRIVIDLQGAQSTGSRTRGIGRYTMALAQAIVKNRNNHEVFLALNGLFADTIEPIRCAFDGLLPQENIRVWYAPGPVAFHDATNHWRKGAAERMREAFLASLKPDIVLVSSLFEGHGDDAVTSVGLLSKTIPTAVILYDLIPYIYPSPYLDNPSVGGWYREKIEHLRRGDLWLAISESSRQEGIEYLDLPANEIVNVSTDADAFFRPLELSCEKEAAIRDQYGLKRPFVMYTGGIDHRKNIDGLIRAYARLPQEIRETHQLAIVCSAQPEQIRHFEEIAHKLGLKPSELVFTGFVPEDHLLALYNLCSLFVFPSWHEGFGLPALEAMRCGAPVIGANTSSLPEVIGLEEALFDPRSDSAMASIMERTLSDQTFKARLIKNSHEQSRKFSWDKSAKRAIEAMEQLHASRQKVSSFGFDEKSRPRLAYVSPLPPARSGIADYSRELLPELSTHYDVDVIIAQENISDSWITEHCPVRSVRWFIENADRYDRVLYHFGNSPFHQHMFELLKQVPGVVVLHDFFLSGIVSFMDVHGIEPNLWADELYKSHGYKAVLDRFTSDDADVVWQYPCSLNVIQDSLGMIVHSANSLRLAEQWFGGESDDWSVIPLLRDSRVQKDRAKARKALGFSEDDFLVCSFGMLGPTKLNHTLLDAWLGSHLAEDKSCHLVFVGENHGNDYGQALLNKIRNTKGKHRIHITGWADADLYKRYLAAADVGVQLRTQSRGETSAAVLDCMNYGLPTIVNANGSMADLDSQSVWKLPDVFSSELLVDALKSLRADEQRRQSLGAAARNIILDQHAPGQCAALYRTAIERFYLSASARMLSSAIAQLPEPAPEKTELIRLAESFARNFHPRNFKRQLLVDISVLVQHDAMTSSQRVVRSILLAWLHNPPAGFRVEPVYASSGHNYLYARRFTTRFLGIPENILQDEPVDFAPRDILFGLDLQLDFIDARRSFYQRLRQQGVQVKFVVYDLLPTVLPVFFVPEAYDLFSSWLEVVTENDGAVCISQSVANELKEWIEASEQKNRRPFEIGWFHLGADIENSCASMGLSPEASDILQQIGDDPSFLMVGTLEPRKGHEQVLNAFDRLWASSASVNLVFVGKQGWIAQEFIERLENHPQRQARLFWLEGISDEYLEKVYAASTCLVAASYGEGFGLPLIEAAQHKLPIIARDIPVFREVAGNHAFYFDSKEPGELADAINDWLELYKKGEHPVSDGMPWLTWEESAQQLLDVIIPESVLVEKTKKEAA